MRVSGNSISIDVENTGAMDGKEVVQLYVSPLSSQVDRPVRELKAFQKVFVKAGEKVTVQLQLHQNAFSYYDEQAGCWQAEKCGYALQICKNANEVILQATMG